MNSTEDRAHKLREAMKSKGLMDFEFNLIKSALGGSQEKAENAVISYTTTTLDAIMAGKMGPPKPNPPKTPPKKPDPPEPTNPNPTIPPISKPSEQDPTRITDTDTGGPLTFEQAMIAK